MVGWLGPPIVWVTKCLLKEDLKRNLTQDILKADINQEQPSFLPNTIWLSNILLTICRFSTRIHVRTWTAATIKRIANKNCSKARPERKLVQINQKISQEHLHPSLESIEHIWKVLEHIYINQFDDTNALFDFFNLTESYWKSWFINYNRAK